MFANSQVTYRDYNNFDGRGEIDGNRRTSVEFKTQWNNLGYSIKRCYFEDNNDYFFKVEGTARNQTGIVRVYAPTDADKASAVVLITLISWNGTTYNYTINKFNFDDHFNDLLGVFTVNFNNLTGGRDYTVNASFSDKYYIKKNGTDNFTTGYGRIGQFEYLQMLINQAIQDEKYEVNLTEPITFDDELDTGQMHIDTHFTLNMNGYAINAKGYCRIFNITGDNVVLKNIRLLNGNPDGRNGSADKNGGALLWLGQNGTMIGLTFLNNTAEYGGECTLMLLL